MSQKKLTVSVLGIGTELTTGQILNRNSSWISEKLKALGLETRLHLTIPDDRPLILDSLNMCAANSDLIFVTGGLGPTSDDFTRDLIAQWTNQKMVWHEPSWQHIQDRLKPRGIAVKEIQKQQCYFPEHAEIFVNRLGTANGFAVEHQNKQVFVLPGPPKEIEGIWIDHLKARFEDLTKDTDRLITKSWDTIGLPESEVAEAAEAALRNCDYEKGYRVHLPYVEFKLTYNKSKALEAKKWIAKIEDSLGANTVLRDGEEIALKLCESLQNFSKVLIIDEIPGSFLMQRMFPFMKGLLAENKIHFLQSLKLDQANGEILKQDNKTILLHLKLDQLGQGTALLRTLGQSRKFEFKSPYNSSLLKERSHQYFAEMAMISWNGEITSN